MAITVLMLTRYGYSHGVQVAFCPMPWSGVGFEFWCRLSGLAVLRAGVTQPPVVPRSWRKLPIKSGVFPAN